MTVAGHNLNTVDRSDYFEASVRAKFDLSEQTQEFGEVTYSTSDGENKNMSLHGGISMNF